MSDTTIAVDTSAVAKKSNPAGKPADGVDAELGGHRRTLRSRGTRPVRAK
ncbi:hypothetical protein [Micromonospora sp. NPDC005087]